jgi:hypothetical protein
MMTEDFGIVRYKAIASSSGANVVDAIADMIAASGDHYWEVDPDVEGATSGRLALRPLQTGATTDTQRIVLFSVTANVSIGYAPDGGLDVTFDDILLAPPPTGLRNITGTTTDFSGITGVYLVEYRDDEVTGPNPAHSLTIFLEGAGLFPFACHVGRVITTTNAGDPDTLDIVGDALLTGAPTATGWLVGSTSATASANLHSSIIRTGATRWSYAAVVDVYAAGSLPLRAVAGAARPTPYTMYGLGTALPVQANATAAGILGETKYLRAYTSVQPHKMTAVSTTPGEPQAWLFFRGAAADQNLCMLWNKEVTTV